MNLKDKKVLIVGFGRSGRAAARYCLEMGAIVSITDKDREAAEQALLNFVAAKFTLPNSGKASFATTHSGKATPRPFDRARGMLRSGHGFAALYLGSHPVEAFEGADIVVLSPGVPLTIEGVRRAREKGVPVIGEMELASFDKPVIAVTGTNGKSTVTTLIGEILKEAGKKALVGGNLGTPLVELLITSHQPRATDFVVLEVSSYQLEISPNFHPHVALLLNITPDHLDRYEKMADYISAKAMIAKNLKGEDLFIYNEDDPIVAKIASGVGSRKIGFSARREIKGLDLKKAKMEGIHNRENMIAAAYAADAVGVGFAVSQKVFERFSGLPHRNQFAGELNGVRFFDDSKGTNVGAVVKSLEGFSSKVVLIAGGLDKGGSYEPLRPLIKEKVKALVLIGEAAGKIKEALGDLTEAVTAEGMAEAVREAASRAVSGDVVLLSPACASFDMFKDYAHRGEVFKEEVMKLCMTKRT